MEDNKNMLAEEDHRKISLGILMVQAITYIQGMVIKTAHERLSNIQGDVVKEVLEGAYTVALDGHLIALDLATDEERKALADTLAEYVRETIANYQPPKPESK